MAERAVLVLEKAKETLGNALVLERHPAGAKCRLKCANRKTGKHIGRTRRVSTTIDESAVAGIPVGIEKAYGRNGR